MGFVMTFSYIYLFAPHYPFLSTSSLQLVPFLSPNSQLSTFYVILFHLDSTYERKHAIFHVVEYMYALRAISSTINSGGNCFINFFIFTGEWDQWMSSFFHAGN
jgi:hypothetical protein